MYKEDTSITIKTGVKNMSQKEVVNLLRQTVWAKDRKKEAIIKSLNHSICYGAFTKNGQQVGFARVITDYATHFYICDVVVKKEFRNKGIGRQLLKTITENEDLKPLLGMLITENAEKFYEPFGFTKNPICFMTNK